MANKLTMSAGPCDTCGSPTYVSFNQVHCSNGPHDPPLKSAEVYFPTFWSKYSGTAQIVSPHEGGPSRERIEKSSVVVAFANYPTTATPNQPKSVYVVKNPAWPAIVGTWVAVPSEIGRRLLRQSCTPTPEGADLPYMVCFTLAT